MSEPIAPEMTMVFLPPRPASQIKGLRLPGTHLRTDPLVIVSAFRVCLAGKVFYAGFIRGGYLVEITDVGAETMKRACEAAAPGANHVILQNSNVTTAAVRTLRAMQLVHHGEILLVFCADAKIWDAATGPFFRSPKVTLVGTDGRICRGKEC